MTYLDHVPPEKEIEMCSVCGVAPAVTYGSEGEALCAECAKEE